MLALPAGFSLGLLGEGGSILAIPIFVYVLGVDRALAIPASLVVLGLTSFLGSIPHRRAGNIDFAAALCFAFGSVSGSVAGAELGLRINDVIQMIVFGCVMLMAAIFMFRERKSLEGKVEGKPIWLLLLMGALVGILISFVGVGGGFMYVPALVFLVGMTMKRAVGTSLLIIGLNAAVAFGRYLLAGEIRSGFANAHIGDLPL